MSEGRDRPASLWAVGILSILMALLGGCGGLWNLGSMAAQDQMLAMRDRALGDQQRTDAQQAQVDFGDRVVEVQRGFRPAMIAGQALNLLGAFGLLIGAILLFRWSPATFVVMAGACGISAVADITTGVVGVLTSNATLEVIQEAGANGADAAQIGGYVGTVFAAGWGLAKLAFYAGALLAVRHGFRDDAPASF